MNDPEEQRSDADLDLNEEEAEQLREVDPDPEPISYSGQDFDVDGLVRRLNRDDIVIPTFGHGDDTIETAGFQRRFVWRRPQMDRFIESLLLGYPIPGIFLVQQTDRRYLVLDGQQRLRTLAAFYSGMHLGREFKLVNVAERFQGLTYKILPEELRRTLDNTFLQATIVRTDGSPASLDAVYQVFERLNAGGTQLVPHEIRVALYAGPFIEYLTELNKMSSWRELYGPESLRLRDQELILRIIALYVSPGTYRRPLKKYLNDFAAAHRQLESLDHVRIRERFQVSTELLLAEAGALALRGKSRQLNTALTEAVMVGLLRRLEVEPFPTPGHVREAVTQLAEDPAVEAAIVKATTNEESVRTRMSAATQTFAQI